MYLRSHSTEEELLHELDSRTHSFNLYCLHLSGVSLLEESLTERLVIFEGKFNEECHPYLHLGAR